MALSEKIHPSPAMAAEDEIYDFVIIGSGFGGSVSALRLAEKGYRVLMLEQGQRFAAQDFPKTNWNLKRWLWAPFFGFWGPFRMTFLRHITIFSGVGVGGGSLVYGNTLPIPKQHFFNSTSWSHLADWATELAPFYKKARQMLGATPNPFLNSTDQLMAELAHDLSQDSQDFRVIHEPTDVAVYFGPPNKWSDDPYFEGQGPRRKGCKACGACMTGCRHDSKNTLDKNYLYLAEKKGVKIRPLAKATGVKPITSLSLKRSYIKEKKPVYAIHYEQFSSHSFLRKLRKQNCIAKAHHVIFAAGVLGTLKLMNQMRMDPTGLPHLSPKLGKGIRTNNESILAVTTTDNQRDFSAGVAISSIVHTDEHSHLEPVRYGKGSGFFRLLIAPHAPGSTFSIRLLRGVKIFLKSPIKYLLVYGPKDFSKRTLILLYMRSLESALEITGTRQLFRKSIRLTSRIPDNAPRPTPFMAEASNIAFKVAQKINGVVSGIFLESILATPSTAHILGGACMGANPEEGVINKNHEVFGYPGLYVVDGSAVSANPGVNPSLTIAALAERAMALIPAKKAVERHAEESALSESEHPNRTSEISTQIHPHSEPMPLPQGDQQHVNSQALFME